MIAIDMPNVAAGAPPDETGTPETAKKRRRRLTKLGLAREAERQLVENGQQVLEDFWEQVGKGVKNREKHALEMIARLFYNDKGAGGVSIVSQTLNINGQAKDPSVRSLEAIVRKLEAKDQFKLPAPTPIRQRPDVDVEIVDAEEVT